MSQRIVDYSSASILEHASISERFGYTRIFFAIAFKVLTWVTSVTFREYSELEREAPMATEKFLQ